MEPQETMPIIPVLPEPPEVVPEIKYFSAETKGFYSSKINTVMPDDAIKLTDTEYNDFFNGMSLGKTLSINSKGKPIAIDRVITAEEKAQLLKDAAQQLLKDNDYRWANNIKWERTPQEGKDIIVKYYDSLVAAVNGETKELPDPITLTGII
jgi:hypothetical protein